VIEALTFAAGLREAQGGQAKLAAFVQGLGDFGQAENPFTTDAVAATLYEQWLVNPLAQNAPETDIVIKPFVKKGTDEAITYADGLAWAIPKGAPNPELAFEFARFMVSPDAWVEGAKAAKEDRELLGGLYLGSYTANRAADERIFTEVYKPTGKKQWDDAVQVIRGLQDKAVTLPASAAGAEVLAALDKAVLQVLTGKATPEAALKAADQEAQTALDRAASGS
jgi:multiple sugar transport system substrate-binding protein